MQHPARSAAGSTPQGLPQRLPPLGLKRLAGRLPGEIGDRDAAPLGELGRRLRRGGEMLGVVLTLDGCLRPPGPDRVVAFDPGEAPDHQGIRFRHLLPGFPRVTLRLASSGGSAGTLRLSKGALALQPREQRPHVVELRFHARQFIPHRRRQKRAFLLGHFFDLHDGLPFVRYGI